ncbi:hypothetical protein FDZ74_08910 [bacterium]|nr:MAG: hypothetical protein FDZ74_08910 [bacterium]
MHHHSATEFEDIRSGIHEHFLKVFGIEDTSAIELFVLLQRVAHLARLIDNELGEDIDLSGPRWRLLLRLFIDEQVGNPDGLTPTVLSHSQRVSKNTISALLRGLETQGLIRRTLVPSDLRAFHIQLTQAGRDYLYANAPKRLKAMQRMLSVLEPQEFDQMTAILNKLHHSLLGQIHAPGCADAADVPAPLADKPTPLVEE